VCFCQLDRILQQGGHLRHVYAAARRLLIIQYTLIGDLSYTSLHFTDLCPVVPYKCRPVVACPCESLDVEGLSRQINTNFASVFHCIRDGIRYRNTNAPTRADKQISKGVTKPGPAVNRLATAPAPSPKTDEHGPSATHLYIPASFKWLALCT
jgi:hypothetical protein